MELQFVSCQISIFETIQFDFSTLRYRLRELAYLNAGITITISEEGGESETFQYEGGISEYVTYLNEGKTSLMDTPMFVSGEKDKIQVEAAFQWTTAFRENIHIYKQYCYKRGRNTFIRFKDCFN